jgi:FkbM family methyltransferase
MVNLRNVLKRTSNKFLGLAGFHVERLNNESNPVPQINSNNLASYLNWLELKHGVPCESVFDIGAHVGAWSTDLAGQLSIEPQFFLFEPNSKHESHLQATGYPSFCVLLAESERWIDFYSIDGTGDSIFRENSKHYEHVAPNRIYSRTLDSVCEEFDLSSPTLIKLDTQGSELAVLRGSSRTLPGVSLLYLECPFLRYNEGVPSLDQNIEYISSIGFLPVGLFEVHISNGVLIQVDILFMSQNLFSRVYGAKSLGAALLLQNPNRH